MSIELPEFSNPKGVARLLDFSCDATNFWEQSELPGLWQAQMDSSIVEDLKEFGLPEALRAQDLCQQHQPAIETWRNLLDHVEPAVELLRALKGLAKGSLQSPEPRLPRPVALGLYNLAIIVADVRADVRISELPVEKLLESCRWLIATSWIDDRSRQLVKNYITLRGN